MSKLTQILNRDSNASFDDEMHKYVDLNIINNNRNGQMIDINFTDNKSGIIIHNTGDYYVAVDRFHISSINLPIFLPVVQTEQEDINLTIYSFTLSYGNFYYQQYMNFIPQNKYINSVNAPLQYQDMTTEYYFVYNYNYLVKLLNNTLSEAFDGLSALTELPTESKCPFLIYDPSTSQIVFNTDSTYDQNLPSPINIYLNNQMRTLLSGFEYLNYGEASSNGMNYKLNIYNNNDYNELNNLDLTTILQTYEQYKCIITWCPISCIALQSFNMSISESIVPDALKFGSNQNLNILSTNMSRPCITDFSVALNIGTEYLPTVDYSSDGNYRLIDMNGHENIKQIKINVIWKDLYGNEYPLKLSSGQSANLKLMFRNKKFNQ